MPVKNDMWAGIVQLAGAIIRWNTVAPSRTRRSITGVSAGVSAGGPAPAARTLWARAASTIRKSRFGRPDEAGGFNTMGFGRVLLRAAGPVYPGLGVLWLCHPATERIEGVPDRAELDREPAVARIPGSEARGSAPGYRPPYDAAETKSVLSRLSERIRINAPLAAATCGAPRTRKPL